MLNREALSSSLLAQQGEGGGHRHDTTANSLSQRSSSTATDAPRREGAAISPFERRISNPMTAYPRSSSGSHTSLSSHRSNASFGFHHSFPAPPSTSNGQPAPFNNGHQASSPAQAATSLGAQTALSPVLTTNSGNTANTASFPRASNGSLSWSQDEEDLLIRCVRAHVSQGWNTVHEMFTKLSKGPPRTMGAMTMRYRRIQGESTSAELASSPSKAARQMRRPSTSTSSTASTVSASRLAQPSSLNSQSHAPNSASSRPLIAGRWPAWSSFEDRVLLQCVERHGQQWTAVQAEFSKVAPQITRSNNSLMRRWEKLQAAAEEALTAQSAAQVSPSSSSLTPNLASASAPSPSPTAPQNWTAEEEAHLLNIALQHLDTSCLLDQVEAVYDDFRAIYPDTTWPLETLHLKYRQLLQTHLEQQAERGNDTAAGEQGRVGDVRGGREGGGGGGTMSVGALSTLTSGEQVCGQSNVHASGARSSLSQHHRSAAVESFAPVTLPTHLNRAISTPSTPSLQTQGNPLHHASPSHNLDCDIFQLPYGLRIERPPRNTQLSIYSATHYKLRSLDDQAAQPAKPATFEFHLTQEGGIVGMVMPPGTKTYPVVMNGNGEQIGQGGGGVPTGVGTYFEGADGYRIEFYRPL